MLLTLVEACCPVLAAGSGLITFNQLAISARWKHPGRKMGVRVVSGRATDKDKSVPEGGQEPEFREMPLGSKGFQLGQGDRATCSSEP